ncbi:MAG: universal stress protein [Longimicrobiales bacterium]
MNPKPPHSILVASDLTSSSDGVLRAAVALAALMDAELHVLHASELDVWAYGPEVAEALSPADRLSAAERELEEQLERTLRPGVEPASRQVVPGPAHLAIGERAGETGADLIVLGPHRHQGPGDRLLGSTSDRVIRTIDVPCLIVRGRLSVPLRRVLVPLDLSDPALGALDVALAWCAALPAYEGDAPIEPTVIVLHVIPRVFDTDAFPIGKLGVGSALHDGVDAALARAGATAAVEVREEVRWNDSATDEILGVIEQEQADLAVLGTHGRGAFGRALIGSVASGVARAAACPVLLVPPALWESS